MIRDFLRAPARILAAAALALMSVTDARADDVGHAKALANRMIDMYASLESYRDSGTILVSVVSPGGETGRSTSRFATRFARPDRLRFDWSRAGDAPGQRAATIWSTADGAYLGIDDEAPARKDNVEAAMLSAGGEASSVLYLVPRYLLMSEKCCGYRNLPGARIIGTEAGGTGTLRVLEFDYSDSLRRRLWLDEQSLLVHKVETISERGDHQVRTVVTFTEVAINEPLDEAVFRVDAGVAAIAAPAEIRFDLTRLDAAGLRGPADGKVSVAYEFCIPGRERLREEVAATDITVRCTRGARGRIGCAPGEMLCIGATHQPGWRRVLETLAALPYVQRIEEAFFE